MSARLGGVMPAVVTPLSPGEEFLPDVFEQLLHRLYRAGSSGIYVCGQAGEGLQQPLPMRKRVAEVAVKSSPRDKTVIVDVGAPRTLNAVELAAHARRIGAHAIASLPPEPRYSFDEVRAYYEAIAAASDMPVIVYYFPEYSPSVATLEQINELCSIRNVAGVKFIDFDVYRMSLIARNGRVVFNGRDEAFAAGALMGASGGIGAFYNIVPELFVDVWKLSSEGRHHDARLVQDRINELIRIVQEYSMLPAIKSILGWQGIEAGCCFAPRQSLTGDEELRLRTELTKAGFI